MSRLGRDEVMRGWADALADGAVVEHDLDRELDARLTECSTLAFRVAFGVLRHRQDAEDVAQEAFIRAHRRFRQLRDRERFRSWLVRLTWRLAIDRQRADRRRAAREQRQGEPPLPETAAEIAVAGERRAQLWRAIDALPERLRLVVVLAGIEGHDVREVARLLAVPEGTVKSRLFHARRRLRELLPWTTATE